MKKINKADDRYKVAIGVPSMGDVRIETTMSLMAMVGSSPNVFFHLIPKVGCYIHMNRDNIVLDAQKEKAEYLLMVDADMDFAPDSLMKLIARNKLIIGADYNFKWTPPRSITTLNPGLLPVNIQKELKQKEDAIPSDRERIFRPIYDDQLKDMADNVIAEEGPDEKINLLVKTKRTPFMCRAVGGGLLLIKMEVFDKIPRPWFFFQPEINDDVKNVKMGAIGEDVWFCDRAWENGIEVWCDPTIDIKHVGVKYY